MPERCSAVSSPPNSTSPSGLPAVSVTIRSLTRESTGPPAAAATYTVGSVGRLDAAYPGVAGNALIAGIARQPEAQGRLFVPFFIVPTLEWLFWGWLKAFVQYSFMLVIANAFIFIFEKFLSRYLQTLPPGMRLEEQLLYGVHAVMILVTFTVGVLLVPSLTSSIFSGRSGESVLPSRIGL